MLKLIGFDSSESKIPLPDFISVEVSREESVPADYMEARFPYFKNAGRLCTLCLYDGDRLLFRGICDETVSTKSGSGAYTYVYCRNAFALLIDNEACPGVYRSITAQVIFNRYLKPLGFKDYIADSGAASGEFTVNKGSSVYEVLGDFCRIRYGSVPKFSQDGAIVFNPVQSEETAVFSDEKIRGVNSLRYSEIQASMLPCRLISSVNVKTSENDYYTTVLDNSFAREKGVVRRRYMDACSESTPLECGVGMLENSNARYEEYRLKLAEFCDVTVGENAEIYDSVFSEIPKLYISAVKYKADKAGTLTEIKLKRKC